MGVFKKYGTPVNQRKPQKVRTTCEPMKNSKGTARM